MTGHQVTKTCLYQLNNLYIRRMRRICKHTHNLDIMGRYQLRFVACCLCIILQCNISIQTPIKANSNCNTVEIRIPVSSISNKNSAPQNQQYGNNYPYQQYYQQLNQYYSNICNSCQGYLCNNRCGYPVNLKSPSNTLSLSVPPNSNSGRLTFIIDNRSAAKPADTNATPNNGENNVGVIVKIVPIDSSNGTAYTSAQSIAKHDNEGNKITALTTAQELDSNSTQNYEILVYVKDVNTGTSPEKTSLQSQIVAENGDGDVLVSKTNSKIVKTAIPAADGDDTTVTGDKPDDTTATTPDGEQQAIPVTPESDTVAVAAPPPGPPPATVASTAGSTAAVGPPATVASTVGSTAAVGPPPGPPPAGVPPPSSPPATVASTAGSTAAVGPPATVASTAGSTAAVGSPPPPGGPPSLPPPSGAAPPDAPPADAIPVPEDADTVAATTTTTSAAAVTD